MSKKQCLAIVIALVAIASSNVVAAYLFSLAAICTVFLDSVDEKE